MQLRLSCKLTALFAGISVAEPPPLQKAAPAVTGTQHTALQSPDSDSAEFSDQADQDSESDDDLDLMLQDSDSASDQDSEQGSELSQEMLEDRQTGQPAETSGRPSVTPGQQTCPVLCTLPVPYSWSYVTWHENLVLAVSCFAHNSSKLSRLRL